MAVPSLGVALILSILPHALSELSSMKKLALIAFICVILNVGCLSERAGNQAANEISFGDLTINRNTLGLSNEVNGKSKITGTVKNNGNDAFDGVSIEINVYSNSGALIATTTAVTGGIAPGGSWEFETLAAPISSVADLDKLEIVEIWGLKRER